MASRQVSLIVGTVAAVAALIATTALIAARASSGPVLSPPDAPVFVVDAGTAVSVPPGSRLAWDWGQEAVLSSRALDAAPTDYDAIRLPAPASEATQFVSFIAAPGDERTPGSWKGWADRYSFDADRSGVLMPDITPYTMINGAELSSVRRLGGTFSAGVAYTKDNGQTVVSAYYTTITVEPGGTWSFSTPAGLATTPPPQK